MFLIFAVLLAQFNKFTSVALVLTAVHLIRTVRWGILLEPVAKVPFGKLNAVSAVGFMALVLLPFRLGEFARRTPRLLLERGRVTGVEGSFLDRDGRPRGRLRVSARAVVLAGSATGSAARVHCESKA